MADWRSKSRTGKSQFIPHLEEIRRRVDLGQTTKQIYDDFIEQGLVNFGYDQFARYIRKNVKQQKAIEVEETKFVLAQSPVAMLPKPQLTPRTGSGDRRREDFQHNPIPDKDRIYAKE